MKTVFHLPPARSARSALIARYRANAERLSDLRAKAQQTAKIREQPFFAAAMRFRTDPAGETAVYERGYRGRNAAREAQLDVKARSVIDAAFPDYCERVHFTFRPGEITAVPVADRTFHIRKAGETPDG